ncbi:MAG: GntR family transcriptional regulator [Hyphomicrobiaceae bacterium]
MRFQTATDPLGRAGARPLTAQPLYGQVRQALLEHIRNGAWMVGDSLPNETFLAQRFGVSVGTIRKAIEGLESSGLVKRIQGRGTYVAGIGSHVLKEKFTRLRAKNGLALVFGYELLAVEQKVASHEIMQAFGAHSDADADAEFIQVRQLIIVDGAVAGLEVSYLKPERLPKFKSQMNFGQDLYPLLADYGLIAIRADDVLSVRAANPVVASTLVVAPGEPIMQVQRMTYGIDKALIEYRLSTYRADIVSYSADIC